MATGQETTRVNKSMLPTYIGRTVRAVGRVTGINNGVLEFMLSDGGSVSVHNSNGYDNGTILEIIAQVWPYSFVLKINIQGKRCKYLRRI
jgi:hypothetical protein